MRLLCGGRSAAVLWQGIPTQYAIYRKAVCELRDVRRRVRFDHEGTKKHHPKWVVWENFAHGEYFYALPLTSELDALCGANANSRTSRGALGAERFSSRVTTTKKKTPLTRCLSW